MKNKSAVETLIKKTKPIFPKDDGLEYGDMSGKTFFLASLDQENCDARRCSDIVLVV